MKRPAPNPESPWLFDLPLERDAPVERPEGAASDPDEAADSGPEPLDLFPEAPAAEPEAGEDDDWPYEESEEAEPLAEEGPGTEGGPTAAPGPPGLGERLKAGLYDLAAAVAVLVLVVAGAAILGVMPRDTLASAPLAVFLGVFTFLYHTLPLAFWGRTPGMAAAGLVARNPGDQPLTFGQTFARWLGAVLTVALAGLPLVLLLTGASLADRLSGSRIQRR